MSGNCQLRILICARNIFARCLLHTHPSTCASCHTAATAAAAGAAPALEHMSGWAGLGRAAWLTACLGCLARLTSLSQYACHGSFGYSYEYQLLSLAFPTITHGSDSQKPLHGPLSTLVSLSCNCRCLPLPLLPFPSVALALISLCLLLCCRFGLLFCFLFCCSVVLYLPSASVDFCTHTPTHMQANMHTHTQMDVHCTCINAIFIYFAFVAVLVHVLCHPSSPRLLPPPPPCPFWLVKNFIIKLLNYFS